MNGYTTGTLPEKHLEMNMADKQLRMYLRDMSHLPEIVMPDGSRVKGLAESEVSKFKIGDSAQFERVGFVRLNKRVKSEDGKEIFEFWFAHP